MSARGSATTCTAAKATRLLIGPGGGVTGAAPVSVYEVMVPSHDGTPVPLSIVHKRGLARDGTNPTLLLGYGAYGFTTDPRFFAPGLAWLERGGVFAVAHVRGGAGPVG